MTKLKAYMGLIYLYHTTEGEEYENQAETLNDYIHSISYTDKIMRKINFSLNELLDHPEECDDPSLVMDEIHEILHNQFPQLFAALEAEVAEHGE